MAVITTNPQQPIDQNGEPVPVLQPAATNNTVVISLSGTASSGVIATPIVRIVATAAVQVDFGGVPVGTTALYIPANTVEYFSINPGNSVFALGTATVYVTPMK